MKSSSSTQGQYAYSRSVTTEACRSVGIRYTQLRDKLPPGFFAGRIIDLQALTAMVFLLHAVYSHGSSSTQPPGPEAHTADDLEIVRKVTTLMETAGASVTGDVAKQGAKALKSMLDHFANPRAAGKRNLTLRVPMLGKVHINRKLVRPPMPTPGLPLQQQQNQGQMSNAGASDIPGYFVPQDQSSQYSGGTAADVDMANSMGWSMDLLGDFPFMADDPYANGDSLLWFNDWQTPPQPQ